MTVPERQSAPISRHETSGGARVYRLTIPAFAHLPANVFLVVLGDPLRPSYTALVDVGGSTPGSTQGLTDGLDAIREEYGEHWSWPTLSRLVITHPHPDHVAGLPFVRTLTPAPVAAHALAVPTIEQPQARVAWQQAGVETYLRWAGITGEYAERIRRRAGNLMLPAGVSVQTRVQGGDTLDGLFNVIHTPGHDGAQICLQVHDLLLSADQLLPRNSPPLMPQRMHAGLGDSGLGDSGQDTYGLGLAHYLASLDKLEALRGVQLALGGHDEPMPRWQERIALVRARYAQKLQAVLDAAGAPTSIYDLTHAVNPRLKPVQALLLLDQTAALVEYLGQRGQLTETLGPRGEGLFRRA